MNKSMVLVVEDDAAICNLIATTLETHNYKYRTAGNGENAILEAVSHNPDVMLPEKIGRITAVYIPETPKAGGWLIFGPDGSIMFPLPETGDASERIMYGWIMLLSILGICILKKKKRGGRPE